jgi:hypothetical protein
LRSEEPDDFLEKAKDLVLHQYNVEGIGTPRGKPIDHLSDDEVYILSYTRLPHSKKVVVGTMRTDGRIYEVTYDANLRRTHLDTYLRTHNRIIPD